MFIKTIFEKLIIRRISFEFMLSILDFIISNRYGAINFSVTPTKKVFLHLKFHVKP